MIEDYKAAKQQGERARRNALLKGRNPYLPALEDIISRQEIAGEVELGVHEIPLSIFAGTRMKGRQNSFADNFMPLLGESTEFAIKWSNLYDYQISEGISDAVVAYEYMHNFYVEEGNKRVSVMKYLKSYSIPTVVTRILPKKTDDKQVKIYYEYLPFYEVTGIFGFVFSEPGCYTRLASQLGQDLETPWPDELVSNFKDAYDKFARIFQSRGERSGLRAEDAFLIYLTMFPLERLLSIEDDRLKKHIDRLWDEFLTETGESKITLVEDPKVIDPKAGTLSEDRVAKFLMTRPIYSSAKPLKLAFIHEKNENNSSWVYGHELGRNSLPEYFGDLVDSITLDNCETEEAFDDAIAAAITDEDDVIFTTSASLMNYTLRAAVEHPKIKFLNCSANLQIKSVRSYAVRMYEAKFLMGAMAASLSENHMIGYYAGYPIYGTVAEINAFAIGAGMVDPRSSVHVKWSSKNKETWEQEFARDGISIISASDFIRPDDPEHLHGVYRLESDGSRTQLAAVMPDWGRYYALIVESILSGSYDARAIARKDRALNYWYGMSQEVIDVIYAKTLPYNTVKMLDMLKRGIVNGHLHPFDGEIHSQDGIIRKAGDPRLTNEEILQMDWLADNVVGTIPKITEIREDARKTVSVAGVKGATEK